MNRIKISFCLFFVYESSWLVESFPRASRLSSVAVGYNIAQAIAGGLSPALATVLTDKKYGVVGPGYLLSSLGFIGLVGLKLSPRNTRVGRKKDSSSL